MKLSNQYIEEQEDDIPEEELEKSLEEQTELEKESVATLTVGVMLGYIYFFE